VFYFSNCIEVTDTKNNHQYNGKYCVRHRKTCSLLHALWIPTRDECECLDSHSIINNAPMLIIYPSTSGGGSGTDSVENSWLDLTRWRELSCPEPVTLLTKLAQVTQSNGLERRDIKLLSVKQLAVTPMLWLRFVLLSQETHYASLTRNVHICGVIVAVEGHCLLHFNCYLLSLHRMCKINS
jgi:hypothetical protein